MNDKPEAFPSVKAVLARIAELQATTAPVTVTIGGVNENNTVIHNEVTVRYAPPAVVKALVSEFDFVGLTEAGLRVACRKESD